MDTKVIKNYLYNVSYQILTIILPFITTPYISRVLSPEGVGIYSYTNSITQYFILFGCIGLNLYGQREIAYYQQKKNKYSIVFFELLFIRIITVSLSIIIFISLAFLYDRYTIVLLIQTIQLVATMVDISWFFQGIEDFKKIVVRNFIVKIIGVCAIFLFVKTSNDLNTYIFIQSFVLFLGNLSIWVYVPKIIQKVNFYQLNISKHIGPAILMFLPQIATSIYTVLDKTMIGLLTGSDAEVAFYEQAEKITKIALTVVTSFGTVMLPRIANIFQNKDFEKIRVYMNKTFDIFILIASPIMFGLMSIAPNFVPWFFGDGYEKVIPNMIIIAPIILIIGMSNVIGTQYLLPTRRQKEYTFSVCMGCLVNVILNLSFIPFLLSYGAAIATLIAETTVTAIQFILVRKEFKFKSIVKRNMKYLVLSFLMFIIIYSLNYVGQQTIIFTLFQIFLGIGFYFGVLIIIKDKIVYEFLYKIIFSKIKR